MKVKVKIAVAVNGSGKWSSCGYQPSGKNTQKDYEEMMGIALDGLDSDLAGDTMYWLTAELDIPQEKETAAEVTKHG